MVCDICDPSKLYRYDEVEKSIIGLPAINLELNANVGWEVKKCRYCRQHFNQHITNKLLDDILV